MRNKERVNTPERLFEELAELKGWKITKRGWPDFLCFTKTGEVIAVEVKPRMRSRSGFRLLKREQAKTMDILVAHGIPCFVSDGKVIERYEPEKHAGEARRYSRHRFAKKLAAETL